MIYLKQVIHYAPTNSVEATWVERTITAQAEVPEVPATEDTPAVPAYTPPDVVTDVQIKCHSYADVQMQMFRDDAATLGTSLADHEPLIAAVEAAIIPYVAPRKTQLQVETEIKAERDRRKDGGTLVSDKWFHSDRDSRIQQLGLVIMGAAVPSVQWKTMDGTFVTMSQAIAGGIFQATATLDMTLFANAETHIEAAKLLDDPTDYDFSKGWPEHFA